MLSCEISNLLSKREKTSQQLRLQLLDPLRLYTILMGGLWACLESLFGMDCLVHGYISGMGGAEHFPAFGAFSEKHLLALVAALLAEERSEVHPIPSSPAYNF